MISESDILSGWEGLSRKALLGSSRAKVEGNESALPGVEFAAAADTPECVLLRQAAFFSPLLRAGRLLPGRADATGETQNSAPPERRPSVNKRSGMHLQTILGAPTRHGLLPEWLATCRIAEKRVPFHLLPDILEFGRRMTAVPSFCSVIGSRGFWLAAQNTDWSYIEYEALHTCYADAPASMFIEARSEMEVRETWRTADKDMRINTLRALRRTGSQLALELVNETWDHESAGDRALMVASLRPDATMADEPFCERALRDRSRDVRLGAAELLMMLPDSAYSVRCRSRARKLIRATRPANGAPSLEVAPPDEADESLKGDGFEPVKTAALKMGEIAQRILFVVGAVPPTYWLNELPMRITPDEFVDAVRRSEWPEPILQGLQQASIRFADPAMIDLLLDPRPELVQRLPAARRLALQENLLRQPDPNLTVLTEKLAFLAASEINGQVCSAPIGRLFLERLAAYAAASKDSGPAQNNSAVSAIGCRLPLELISDVRDSWLASPEASERWQNFAFDLFRILEFRKDMIREIYAP